MVFGLRTSLAFLAAVLCIAPNLASQARSQPDVREQAWLVLHSGLENKWASRRCAAVQALSLMQGDRRAVRFAVSALRDKNFHVRATAAMTLGNLHDFSTLPELHSALKDPEVSVVLAAAHSLYLLHDKDAYQIYYAILMGDQKSSDGLVQSQLDRLKDPKQLLQMGFEEGIGFVPFGGMSYEAYRQLRSSGDSGARVAAAHILANDPDPITEDALMQTALSDKNELVQLAALDALAERGDPKCIERLALNLDNAKSSVQYRTAAAIIHLSDVQLRGKRPHH
ncbi:MAG TPA: HEAT repeat domain-containing protein [Terriglobales bacterium]